MPYIFLKETAAELHMHSAKYIEDIYSFAVNTINIVIECNETSVFSRLRSTSENLNVFITREENCYGIH